MSLRPTRPQPIDEMIAIGWVVEMTTYRADEPTQNRSERLAVYADASPLTDGSLPLDVIAAAPVAVWPSGAAVTDAADGVVSVEVWINTTPTSGARNASHADHRRGHDRRGTSRRLEGAPVKLVASAGGVVMATLIASFVLVVLVVTGAGGDGRLATAACATDANLAPILATIRTIESGGDYTAEAVGSTASGAYQFIDGTWNNYGGYTRAVQAPPEQQDQKAAEMIRAVLVEHDNSVAAIPVVWYIGHLPDDGAGRMGHHPRAERRQRPHTTRVPDEMDAGIRDAISGRRHHDLHQCCRHLR